MISYAFPEDGHISKPASRQRGSDRQGSSFDSCCRYFRQAFLVGSFFFSVSTGTFNKSVLPFIPQNPRKKANDKGENNSN